MKDLEIHIRVTPEGMISSGMDIPNMTSGQLIGSQQALLRVGSVIIEKGKQQMGLSEEGYVKQMFERNLDKIILPTNK